MEKKIKHRILYITVACLWGVAIYRTYMNYSVDEEQLISESNSFKITPVNAYIKDSFELELPVRDPFLKSEWKSVVEIQINNTNSNQKKSEEKIKPVPQEIKWPEIKYFGFVKNRQTNSTRCLVQIDNSTTQINKGEIFNEVKIIEPWHDSVLVQFKNEKRIIRR